MGIRQFLTSAKKRLMFYIHPGNMENIVREVDKAEDDLDEIRTTYYTLKGRAQRAVEDSANITHRMLVEQKEN